MRSKLLASASSLDGLLRLTREYYYNDTIIFEHDGTTTWGTSMWSVHTLHRKMTDCWVCKKGNRYRLETNVLNAAM